MSEATSNQSPLAEVDEALRRQAERAHRHRRLTRQRQELTAQMEAAQHALAAAEQQLAKERADVAQVEHDSWNKGVRDLAQGRVPQLDRERWEAAAAQQRAEGQRARLATMQADLEAIDRELAPLRGAPEQYQAARRRKEELLRRSDDPRSHELDALDGRTGEAQAAYREHDRAFQAGMAASQPLGALAERLGSAHKWSTFDMFIGRGWAKRERLMQASQAAWHAQQALDVFARELTDIGVTTAPRLPQVDAGGFAELFFDNIISDAIRHQKINETTNQVNAVGQWLNDTLRWLDQRKGEIARDIDAMRKQREDLLGP